MTIYRSLNKACLGGNHSTWWIIKTMVDAGWTVPMSGSGTSGIYDTSNIFDMTQTPKQNTLKDANNQGVGSEPWGHGNCWIVLEDPSGNRQYIIRRHATQADVYDAYWHFGYSPGGLFGVGETPGVEWDETTEPSATDIGDLCGTSAATAACFEQGGNSNLIHVAADDTASPEGEYGVLALDFKATNNNFCSFVIDDLRNAPVGHPHPVVNCLELTDNSFVIAQLGTNQAPGTIQDYGGGAQTYNSVTKALYYRYGATNCIPTAGGVGTDGEERAFPIPIGFTGTENYMGTSRWLYWASVARGYPNTANSETLLFVNDVVVSDLLDGLTTPASI